MMRRPITPQHRRGVLNIGFALVFVALLGCTGVALDVAQLRRQSALQHMASLRPSGVVPTHLQAKELE